MAGNTKDNHFFSTHVIPDVLPFSLLFFELPVIPISYKSNHQKVTHINAFRTRHSRASLYRQGKRERNSK
jgi:hypothetical protein